MMSFHPRTGLILVGLALALSVPLSAQQDSRLVEAVRLAQEGQGDAGRAAATRLLEATAPTDTLYPEILYTLGSIARTAQDMRRNFQRVAVEYPLSSWADDALVRLTQLDYAGGDFAGAARTADRFRRDYPNSALLPIAAFWGARAQFDLNNPPAACRWLTEGLAAVGGNVELRNQLEFYRQRCAGVAPDTGVAPPAGPVAAKADTPATPAPVPAATPRPAAPAPQPVAEPTRPFYRVQVAAVRSRQAADQVSQRIKELGYEAVVVSEGGLLKVRAGRFADRAAAETAVDRIQKALGGGPFIVAEP